MERLCMSIFNAFIAVVVCLAGVVHSVYAETITEDTILASGNYQYSSDLVINPGVTLTIEAGSYLAFDTGKGIVVKGDARLQVLGDVDNPVTLTATNLSSTSWFSWRGITFDASSEGQLASVIEHAHIRHANTAMRLMSNVTVNISNSVFDDNYYAVYINAKGEANIEGSEFANGDTAIYMGSSNTHASLVGNSIHHNKYGLYITGGNASVNFHPLPTLTNNSFFENSSFNVYTKSYSNGWQSTINAQNNWWGTADPAEVAKTIYDVADYFYGGPQVDFSNFLDAMNGNPVEGKFLINNIAEDTTLSGEDWVLVQDVSVLPSVNLTVAPGTTIRGVSGSRLTIKSKAKLHLQGTAELPITLSSHAQQRASWRGIRVEGFSDTQNDIAISHTRIEFADRAIEINSNRSAQINNATINQNSYGVYLHTNSYVNINNSNITDNYRGLYVFGKDTLADITSNKIWSNDYGIEINGHGGFVSQHTQANINNNSFDGNINYDIYVSNFSDPTKSTINAKRNWWGTTNPASMSERIYDYSDNSRALVVDFSDFLDAENGNVVEGNFLLLPFEEDTVLTEPEYTIVGNWSIQPNTTITVPAGTTINALANSKIEVMANSEFHVQGTAELPVLFTSSSKWEGIVVSGARETVNEVTFNHAIIENAQNGIKLNYQSKALIDNSIIRGNNYGVYFSTKLTEATVTNSQIYDNNYGVYVYGSFSYAAEHPKPTINFNKIYNNNVYNFYAIYFYDKEKVMLDAKHNWWGTLDVSQINQSIYDAADNSAWSPYVDFSSMLDSQGAQVSGEQVLGYIEGETRWQSDNLTVVSDVRVQEGAHLIIESGSQISFAKNTQLFVNKNASITIAGEESAPVLLSSLSLTPTPGDWKGIKIEAENKSAHISHAIIEYADKALSFNGKKATGVVTNSIIRKNTIGLHVNGDYKQFSEHPQPIATNNNISENTSFNYYAQSFGSANTRTLNAKGNYWGTIDESIISQKIYDNKNSASSPHVDVGFARSSLPPSLTVNAGDDVVSYGTVETTLTGTATSTTPVMSYQWHQYLGDTPLLTDHSSNVTTFTHDDVENSKLYGLLLTATDENGISASDKLSVTIKPFSQYNKAPQIEESPVILVSGGENVEVALAVTDEENDPLTYQWTQISGDPITLTTTNTNAISFVSPEHRANKIYRFKLSVSDLYTTAEREVTIAVKPPKDSTGIYYFHNDHLGTPQVITDEPGNVSWAAKYTPFGKAEILTEEVTNNIRFPGQYFDLESGLHYNYFRDYDPELGRYIQSDPIGLAGGINTYGYAYQSPIMNYDPYGLDVWGVNLGFGGTNKAKGAYSYQFMFDSHGNFAVQKTWETGIGEGKAYGAFATLVYGTPDHVFDLEGHGGSFSGSGFNLAGAVNFPISTDYQESCGEFNSFSAGSPGMTYEFGISRGTKGYEYGFTYTNTETVWGSSALGDIGRYIGSKVYSWTH